VLRLADWLSRGYVAWYERWRLLRLLFVLGSGAPTEAAGSSFLLTPLPLPQGILAMSALPLLKRAVLVVETEITEVPGRKPPLDETTQGGASTPAVRIAGTRVTARVVDPA